MRKPFRLWLGLRKVLTATCQPDLFFVRQIYGELNIRLTKKERPPRNRRRPDAEFSFSSGADGQDSTRGAPNSRIHNHLGRKQFGNCLKRRSCGSRHDHQYRSDHSRCCDNWSLNSGRAVFGSLSDFSREGRRREPDCFSRGRRHRRSRSLPLHPAWVPPGPFQLRAVRAYSSSLRLPRVYRGYG